MRNNSAISSLSPYKTGLSTEDIAKKYKIKPESIIKLASNESPFGPTLNMEMSSRDVSIYPNQDELIKVLAKHTSLHPSNIILGNGSNDVLLNIALTFLEHGAESIVSQYAFGVYKLLTRMMGAGVMEVQADNFGHDLFAMRESVTKNTRIVWVANPNNPTGTVHSRTEIENFIKRIDKSVIVVLDEAYFEYLEPQDRSRVRNLLSIHQNLIIVRTFSKAYGLAGVRLGYAMANPSLIELMNRVRQPFNVNELALQSGIIALADQTHIKEVCSLNMSSRNQLSEGLESLKLDFMPSAANFITVKFNDAERVFNELLKVGIIVRPLKEYGLDNYLRITCGTEIQNRKVLEVLERIIYER